MKNYKNLKTSKLREFIRTYILSRPLLQTKSAAGRVLDLGCGWGFYFKMNPLAYGIDIDDDCLRHLKNLGYNVVKGDITKKLPFEDNSFEWVVCHDVLEHFILDDVKRIFPEVWRILKPNGCFLILIPNQKGYDSGLKRGVGHKHFITLQEILAVAKKNFILQKYYFYPFPKMIGDFFTHNKKVIVLKKVK